MRFSQLFGQTLRDTPAGTGNTGINLLIRAGFVHALGNGNLALLPLGRRSLTRIEALLGDELNAIGGQEISMPPGLSWESSITSLVRTEVRSYRQLPRLIYQPNAVGRCAGSYHPVLDAFCTPGSTHCYSLDLDRDGYARQFHAIDRVFHNLCHRCGVEVIPISADPGSVENCLSLEMVHLSPTGEDRLLQCNKCSYAADLRLARFQKPDASREQLQPLSKVQTPDCKSIEALAAFLGVPAGRTAKAVFFMAHTSEGSSSNASPSADDIFIFAVIRGDLALSETKLAKVIPAASLRPATEIEIQAIGAVPGYASPIGLAKIKPEFRVKIVVDDSIANSPNLVAGANETGFHLMNTNFPRDYQADFIADIAAAGDGDACPRCGSPMALRRGDILGSLSQLGEKFVEKHECSYLDRDGRQKSITMGVFAINLEKILLCAAQEHHDDQGLVWPVTVAPFQVYLLLLRGKGLPGLEAAADKLYTDLQASGIEVFYDDREESPGVKFNDADLIGLPIRLTISERALAQGGIEMKIRSEAAKRSIPIDSVPAEIRLALEALAPGSASLNLPDCESGC